LQSRISLLQLLDPYVGKYYSMQWAKENVLHMDEKEIKEIEQQIEQEHAAQLQYAAQQGAVDGAQQTAQNNFMQANALPSPEDQQQDAQDAQDGQDAQDQQASGAAEAQDTQNTQQNQPAKKSTGWPN